MAFLMIVAIGVDREASAERLKALEQRVRDIAARRPQS